MLYCRPSPISWITNQKFKSKGCDWILGNIVGQNTSTFGGEENSILFKTNKSEESWHTMTKAAVANRLVNEIINELGTNYVNQI